jgi:DHA2 family methylenomycin A resistance protein-like MFS transporter
MTTQPPAADATSARGRRMTLIATSLGFAVVQLDVSVVNVAVKSIGSALGGGVSGLQWVVSAYTVAFAAFILTAGSLGDRIGARRVFVGGFCLFTAASVVCGLAPDLGVLVGARAVQGVGAAILVPASLSLLNHSYEDPAARARAVGLYLAGASLALSGGPLVGGLLIASLGWRAIFFINVPIAAAGVWLTLRWAGETSTARDRGIDVPGQLAAVIALVALVAATIDGGRVGFGDPLVLAGFGVAAAAVAIFVVIEGRSTEPMLPLTLFRHRTFSASTAIGLLINICFYGLIFVFSLLFQREQHLTPLQTGLALAPIMVAITGANLLAARIAGWLGPRATIASGAVLIAAGCGALLGVDAATSYVTMIVPIAVLGFGAGMIVPVITSEMLGSVERSRSGVAAGTLNTMRQTGSALGVALFGSLIAGTFISGLHVALVICIGLVAAIAVLTPLLDRRLRAAA